MLPPDGKWVNMRTPGGLTGWRRDMDLKPHVAPATPGDGSNPLPTATPEN
jgi:hypothetical protein